MDKHLNKPNNIKYRDPEPPVRTPKEEPAYHIPDRHCDTDGEGTMKDGAGLTNRSYKQPWVEHDPTKPEDPKIG